MIHLCTCIGGSASSTISSRKRRGGSVVSCKNCGGRPAIDGKSSSGCLLSAVLELTSLINSDFTWTKISKGCRSSSRRPRTLSNTFNFGHSTDLEMPVSESEKLGVSVLECRFSEKAEHIPLKKRRYLFKPSSPTHNIANPPLEGTERHETSPKLNANENSVSDTSGALTETCESGSKDHKLDQNKLVKDDDFSGISILAAAACSNSLGAETDGSEGSRVTSSVNHAVPKNVEFNENNVKKEPDSHTSTTPSNIEESTLDNSSSDAPLASAVSETNQEPNIQSPARDVRFSWDLNTVMDVWEEPSINEHVISASDAAADNSTSVEEKKDDYSNENNSSGNLPVELKNLSHESKELKVEKYEPLTHDFEIAQRAVVVKTEYMHDKHTVSASDDIPVTRTLTLENPTHGTFSKWANLSGQSSGGFDSAQPVNTKLSMDCSIPPGFDNCFNLLASKENVGLATTHELSLNTATCMKNEPNQGGVTSNKVDEDMTKMELTSTVVVTEDMVNKEEETEQPAAVSSMQDPARSDAGNGFGYDNSQSDNRAASGIEKDKVDEGFDSQYEDGELRESTINAWKGYGFIEGQNDYDMNKIEDGLAPSIVDANETSCRNVQANSTAIKESTELGTGKEVDLTTPSAVLTEKFHSGDEALSGSRLNEIIDQEKSGRQDFVQQHAASRSDEWKMNVSGWDRLPEDYKTNSNNFTKTRNFTARKFSYREEQKDRFDTEDVEMKAEGSRFYRKESLTRIGGPSTRDVFLSRGRFQTQRCSSKDGDGLSSRPERESGALRSFGRGRYSPPNRPTGRGLWNRSPERSRQGGPSFHRSILEDCRAMDTMTNEGGMELSDTGRHNVSYVTRRHFRSRSPMNQEADEFRARLGLRPTGDTGRDRFVSLSRGRGRGRSMRYGTRLDDEGLRGRYHGPTSDECDEFMTEYSHPFPRGRRCYSPIERRGNNNSYQHHPSDSRSPSRPRTRSPIGNSGFRRRSRSPGFRPDGRIRRPRSPTYRDHPSEYNSGPRNNNSPPPSSRWVSYKERPVFNRSPPPGRADGPPGERFSFYDSSRKPKQNDYYRSGHSGRFSDINEGGRGRPRYVSNDGERPNNGYRRGGFVRRYNMDGPARRFQYDDEDEFGRAFDARDRHALEQHARSNSNPNANSKPSSDGIDSRFRDFPRRQRDDGGDFKRRSREGKDPKEENEHVTNDFERRPKEVKDQSTTSTSTNLDSAIPNDVVKEGDNKPISESN